VTSSKNLRLHTGAVVMNFARVFSLSHVIHSHGSQVVSYYSSNMSGPCKGVSNQKGQVCSRAVTVKCAKCGYLCEPCNQAIHITARLRQHDRSPIVSQCEVDDCTSPATVDCEDCGMLCAPHDLSLHEVEQHPRVPIVAASQTSAAATAAATAAVASADTAVAVSASHFEPGSPGSAVAAVAAVATAPLPATIGSNDNSQREIQRLTEQIRQLTVERDTAVAERAAALASVDAAVNAVTLEKDAFIEAERVRLNKEMERAIKAERNRILQEQKAESARVRHPTDN
jgi:hypothetical protein